MALTEMSAGAKLVDVVILGVTFATVTQVIPAIAGLLSIGWYGWLWIKNGREAWKAYKARKGHDQ